MPQITLTISEQQEAKIRDLIDGRKSFRIDGGQVMDSKGNVVQLKEIVFSFAGCEPVDPYLGGVPGWSND